MELTAEEKVIIEEYRKLTAFGRLEITKQSGKLFELQVIEKKRFIAQQPIPSKRELSMV